jgi:hypothetical protein
VTPDGPFPTNPSASIVDPVLDGVFNAALTIAETALIADFPVVFGLPVIGLLAQFVLKQVLGYLANRVYRQFALMVMFTIIDYQISGEVSDAGQALAALKAAQLKGDPNEIQTALVHFQAATVSLTRFDGADPAGSL